MDKNELNQSNKAADHKTEELSESDKKLLRSGRALSDLMPFKASHMMATSMVLSCPCCRKQIPNAEVRANLTDVPGCATLFEAIGLCSGCKMYSRFGYRFYEDGRVLQYQSGKWRETRPSVNHDKGSGFTRYVFEMGWLMRSLFNYLVYLLVGLAKRVGGSKDEKK